MRLVADESVDRLIVERLRRRGLEVTFVAELDPGLPDDAVLALANDRNALLLTGDKDFGELVFRLRKVSAGVVLVRLAGLKPERKAEIVEACVTRYGKELSGAFTVIAAGGVRIRKVQGAEAEH